MKELKRTFSTFVNGPHSDPSSDWKWQREGFDSDESRSHLIGLPPFLYAESWPRAVNLIESLVVQNEGERKDASRPYPATTDCSFQLVSSHVLVRARAFSFWSRIWMIKF